MLQNSVVSPSYLNHFVRTNKGKFTIQKKVYSKLTAKTFSQFHEKELF